MRILMLTQWFHPEPFFKGLPFAQALQARGHEVEVLTGFPNYPGGRLYPGYRVCFHQVEDIGGVRVHRVPLFPSHGAAPLRRIWNYVSFAIAAICIGPWIVRRPDLVYVYHPPATVGLPALGLAARFRCPFVYDVQDLWPDTLKATGMVSSRVVLALVGWWCRAIYASARHIVVLSPGFKRQLVARGVPASRVDVIMNWAQEFDDAVDASASAADCAPSGASFDVLFAGNIGKGQALDTILDAAEILRVKASAIRFVLMGDGLEKARLEQVARARGLANVVFTGRVPPSEAARCMSAASALVVHLRRDPLFEITIPSKTQAYLAAGKPILMGVAGDAADLVRQAGAGILFAPEDPQALAEAAWHIFRLPAAERDAMGQRGRAFYREFLSQDVAVTRFEALFLDVVSSRGATLR